MSILARNLWRFMTAVLTALLLFAASSSAYAHHHHHAHHQHHTAPTVGIGEDKLKAAPTQSAGHHQHEHQSKHSHHDGDCPMKFVCECNGLGCCGERYKGAITRTATTIEPINGIDNAGRIALIIFLRGAGVDDLEARKRQDWLSEFEPPTYNWRSFLYADSPRLRI